MAWNLDFISEEDFTETYSCNNYEIWRKIRIL